MWVREIKCRSAALHSKIFTNRTSSLAFFFLSQGSLDFNLSLSLDFSVTNELDELNFSLFFTQNMQA